MASPFASKARLPLHPHPLFGIERVTEYSPQTGAEIERWRAVRLDPATGTVEPLRVPYGVPMELRWAATEASHALYREMMGFGSRSQNAVNDRVPEIGETNPLDRSTIKVST